MLRLQDGAYPETDYISVKKSTFVFFASDSFIDIHFNIYYESGSVSDFISLDRDSIIKLRDHLTKLLGE